jgi:DNA modification methylase
VSEVLLGEAREVLRSLPAGSVHAVVTSPPYWGLRDYGLEPVVWGGDLAGCPHEWGDWQESHDEREGVKAGKTRTTDRHYGEESRRFDGNHQKHTAGAFCRRCGAWRGSLGLEPTPELFVEHIVEVMREVRRVLRDDGSLWLNMGDSYAASRSGPFGESSTLNGSRHAPQESRRAKEAAGRPSSRWHFEPWGLKPKDLLLMPARVALALQQPYYTGRIKAERDRVWMAAMIDGEGTICGFRHVRPDGNVRTGTLVFVTNGSTAILNECDRIWPGARYIETLKAGDEVLGATATRDCWRWQLQKAEDRSLFLREIYPYLVEKYRQCIVAYNLTELSIAAKKMGRGGETKTVKEKRDLLARLLSDLNQHRDVDLPTWLKEPPPPTEPGWYLRSDVIWSKNNPMPESVTDRPTRSHEYVFLLAKRATYFMDMEAIREPPTQQPQRRYSGNHMRRGIPGQRDDGGQKALRDTPQVDAPEAGRNKRTVWEIATQPYPDAHFATFPEKLVEPCIMAGTSERGVCRDCGAPWERVVERERSFESGSGRSGNLPAGKNGARVQGGGETLDVRRGPTLHTSTIGWRPTCAHEGEPVAAVVLDPFCGSGTVGVVAARLGRRAILIDANPDYVTMARHRTAQLGMLAT